MKIYDMQINAQINPIYVDGQTPAFSWKLSSDKFDIMQESYRIVIASDMHCENVIYDSGEINSDKSINIKFKSFKLLPSTRYYWNVEVTNNHKTTYKSETSYFETGLMGTDKTVWSGANWIGSPKSTVNTDSLTTFALSADFKVEKGNKAGFVICARNKDNYVLIEVDMDKRVVMAYEYCDNAWTTCIPTVEERGCIDGYKISEKAVAIGNEYKENHIKIAVNEGTVNVKINDVRVLDNIENIISQNIVNKPRKRSMMNIGFKQENSCAVYDNIQIEDINSGEVYGKDDFSSENGILSALGKVTDSKLVVENEFNLVNISPSVNVRKLFKTKREVKSARLYSSARGFYDVYINGEKVNDDFYNPGFTDYRKRIHYQVYDVTDRIKQGKNVIGAIISKGYYTGYVGYNANTMLYGKQNSFIGKLIINYTDGTQDIIVTDNTWQFTDKGPVVDADYLQGESYDARLEFDWNDVDDMRWGKCGTKEWPVEVKATNGTLCGAKFELTAQDGPTAKIERILKPCSVMTQSIQGHFVFDLGQNVVGTIRLKVKGERGKSIKIRYGEICYKDGSVYIENLRNAANTDIYTLRGDENGEEIIFSHTSHGFRYVEITGNGYTLTKEDAESLILNVEGLVITNTTVETGNFECSNNDVNKLQSNIQWGQRGNSLLVYTDCPQRNERMGWTGDAQVFAKTAAYNMDVRAFMNKWLVDVADGQLLYNLDGAVPDTAPLGGDNRKTGGCAGWADAAVIVPWEMYKAYGDVSILENNYDMMKKWVDYQSLDYRQDYGVRTVNGVQVPDKSDVSSERYIQIQQSRGDHLTFDESTPFILSATAYAAYVSKLLADIAAILGNRDDAKKYLERFENVKKAFNEAWVRDDGSLAYWGEQSKAVEDINGNIINQTYYSNIEGSNSKPSQTAYALAIDFGLIPEKKISRAAECFKESIDDRNGKLSVGFLGISHLVPALTKVGLTDMAFKLLLEEDNPSWLYSVKNGATTIWERWNSYIAETDTFGDVNMNSFNHYSYGAIGEWMFSDILGINTSEKVGETGYKKIILKPTIGENMMYAKGYHDSAYGKIMSEWKVGGDVLVYNCTIPPNTTATLYLQANNDIILVPKNALYKGVLDGRAVFDLKSGSYEFKSRV